ncbi:MAG TPA: hypothetical protein VHY09_01435 [Candidatus Methylacidiphilales bacterium]|nr:hypothetical protein [Candidatus Methylacidiphilales bacterium]
MNFRQLLLLAGSLLLLGSFAGTAFASEIIARPDANGIIRLDSKMIDGRALHVRIMLRRTNQTDREEARFLDEHNLGSDWWGGNLVPDHIISTFEVRVGKEEVPLFRSAYADLSDVRIAKLDASKSGFSISVCGGETGTGYIARIEFEGPYLKGREVSHNEMGLQEKDQYFPVRDN